jgi:predicted dienelactone hydrolase
LGKYAPKGGKVKFKKVKITSSQAYEGSLISTSGPFPLVMYEFGTTGSPVSGYHVNEALASHGFVTVASNHPGVSIIEVVLGTRTPGPVARLERPADSKFVLDAMLAKNADPGDPFYNLIDPDRIGVLGGSFGAYNAFALAGGVSGIGIEADGRYKGLVGYAPGGTAVISNEDFAQIEISSLLLGGTRDTMVVIDPMITRPFNNMSGSPRYRVDMQEAAHDAWVNGCEWGEAALAAGVTELSDVYLRSYVECPPDNHISRAMALRLGRLYTVSFFLTYVADVDGYQSFLTPGYGQSSEPSAEVFVKGE